MARLLAQFSENRIKQGIFEFLGNNRAGQSRISARQTEPLEIAVVITSVNEAALRSGRAIDLFQVFELDVIVKIFGRQTRAPQKIKHRAREILKRFARNSFAFARCESIAKRNFEIT